MTFRQKGLLDRMLGPPGADNPLKHKMRAALLQYLPGQISCRDFEQFVVDYVDGTLPPRQRSMFDLHMRICPICWVHFQSYLRVVEMGKRVCTDADGEIAEDIPDDLVNAILSARSVR